MTAVVILLATCGYDCYSPSQCLKKKETYSNKTYSDLHENHDQLKVCDRIPNPAPCSSLKYGRKNIILLDGFVHPPEIVNAHALMLAASRLSIAEQKFNFYRR